MRSSSVLAVVWLVGAAACGAGDVAADDGNGEEGEGEAGEGEGEAGEGEGEEGEGEGAVDVVINEVFCRDLDGIEIINRAPTGLDLGRVAVGDNPDDLEASLTGTLPAGARVVVSLSARIACGTDAVSLAVDGVVVDTAPKRLLPADATIGRFPDGTGEFVVVTPTRGSENLRYVDSSARLFDTLNEGVASTLPQLAITLSATAEASLRADHKTKVEGSVTFTDADGVVGPVVAGVRLKGQSSLRTLDGKAAFKIDFGAFAADSLFGVEELTLNNMVQDNSASHERLFYGLLEREGLPAPRNGTVRVSVNGVDFGVYMALQAHDEAGFLGRHFTSSAHLYEGEYGQDLFVSQLNNLDEDFGSDALRTDLAAVLNTIEAASEHDFMADTAAVIDWSQTLPNMAADMVCSHWDSYTATKNNFYLHLDDDGVMSVLSSGPDQAFTEDIALHGDPATRSRLLTRCLADDVCAAAFDVEASLFADHLDDWLNAGGRDRLRADAATLTTLFVTDSRQDWDENQIVPLVEQLITTLDARVAIGRGQ